MHACCRAQELCTCSLQAVLQSGVLEAEPALATRWVRAGLVCGRAAPLLQQGRCRSVPFSSTNAPHLAVLQPSTPRALSCAAQAQCLQVLTQAAAGLEYLHGLGIIHGGTANDSRHAPRWRVSSRPCANSVGLHAPVNAWRADLTPANILLRLDSKAADGLLVKLAVSPLRRHVLGLGWWWRRTARPPRSASSSSR